MSDIEIEDGLGEASARAGVDETLLRLTDVWEAHLLDQEVFGPTSGRTERIVRDAARAAAFSLLERCRRTGLTLTLTVEEPARYEDAPLSRDQLGVIVYRAIRARAKELDLNGSRTWDDISGRDKETNRQIGEAVVDAYRRYCGQMYVSDGSVS